MDLFDLFITISIQDEASAEIKKITKSLDKAIASFGEVSEKGGKGFEDLNKKVKETSEQVKKASEQAGKAAKTVKKVPEQGEKIGEKISEGSKEGKEALEKLGQSGAKTAGLLEANFEKVAAAVGAAFTVKKAIGFMVSSLNTAADAETSFAKVQTLLSSDTDVKAYYESVRKGAQEAGMSLTEYTDALYQSLSASVDQGNAINFTTESAMLARGGYMDLTTAVDVLTTIQNAYGLSTKQTSRIADKLITTQNLGKVTVGQLSNVLGRSIPVANSYNISLEELLASYAALTKNGNGAEETTTLLNATFNELGKYGTTAATILKEKTGKSFSQLIASGTSLVDVIGILQDTATQAGLAIGDVFGSAEASRGAKLILANAKDITSAMTAMGDSMGAAAEANATMLNTYNEQLKTLKANWEMLKETIGKGIVPTATKAVVQLNDVLTGQAYGKRQYGVFDGMAESAEEATAKAEQFKAVMDDLNDQYSGDNAGMIWSKEDTQAFNNAKMNYEGYIKLAEELTQANAEMGESGVDAANLLSNATNEYVGSMQTVLDQYQATYEATLANIDKWFSPFEKVSKQQKHTFDEMKTGLQSQIDFYGNFNDTIQTLTDSGLGSMSKMFVDMGPEGISWANSIVEALDKAGGATSEKGQGIIQDLIDMQDQLTQSKEALSGSVSEAAEGTIEKIQQITENYMENISQWDKSTEAQENAISTISSFVAGLTSSQGDIMAAAGDIGTKITQAIQGNVGDIHTTVYADIVMSGQGRAIGLNYVPYNGMPATLHRGEAILNAPEAEEWRKGKSRGNSHGIVINQTIQAVPQTPIQLAAATQAMFEQARWSI